MVMGRENLKKAIAFLVVLLAISTASMIYLSSIEDVAFDHDLYLDKFDEYEVQLHFYPYTNLTNESKVLIDYLENGAGEIDSNFYNEKEKIHLVEVRGLFWWVRVLLNASVVLSIISMFLLLFFVRRYTAKMKPQFHREYFKKVLSRLLVLTGWIVDGTAVVCGLMMLGFSWSFVWFHKILFRTNTWMLNPRVDNLIKMFPQEFFFDMFVRIVVMSVLTATVMLVVGYLIRLGKPKFMEKKK